MNIMNGLKYLILNFRELSLSCLKGYAYVCQSSGDILDPSLVFMHSNFDTPFEYVKHKFDEVKICLQKIKQLKTFKSLASNFISNIITPELQRKEKSKQNY